jgi:hypothetical protein
MLEPLLMSILLVAATVAIHAFGTTHWMRFVRHRFATPRGHLTPRSLHARQSDRRMPVRNTGTRIAGRGTYAWLWGLAQ